MPRGPKNNLNSHKLPRETEGYILSPMEMSTELVFWRDMIAATNSRLAEYFRPE
jgi:hypothetical protein